MTSAYPLSDSSYPFTVFTPSSINASGAYTVSDKQINYTDKNRTTFQFQSNAFTYTVSNTTPNYKNGSFQVTVSGNNGNPFLVYAMDCILFAPYNSTSGWIDPYNNWQPNPASYTPYSQSGWTRTGTFVGPAITNSFSDVHKPTIGVDFHFRKFEMQGSSVALQLWDIAGAFRRRACARWGYCGEAF
jgi:hypothetical protein